MTWRNVSIAPSVPAPEREPDVEHLVCGRPELRWSGRRAASTTRAVASSGSGGSSSSGLGVRDRPARVSAGTGIAGTIRGSSAGDRPAPKRTHAHRPERAHRRCRRAGRDRRERPGRDRPGRAGRVGARTHGDRRSAQVRRRRWRDRATRAGSVGVAVSVAIGVAAAARPGALATAPAARPIRRRHVPGEAVRSAGHGVVPVDGQVGQQRGGLALVVDPAGDEEDPTLDPRRPGLLVQPREDDDLDRRPGGPRG